jgi:small subunit ribosomal protein S3
MGQKINPLSYRLGITKNWPVRWFTKNYAKFLEEDEAIRKTINEKIGQAGIAAIEIERAGGNVKIWIKAARPGFIIGRGGKGIEDLNKSIETAIKKLYKAKKLSGNLSVNVEELKRSEISAQYVAQQVAWDLEKRMPYRRTMKKYLEGTTQNKEVKGAKILLSGRLDGNEIARREWLATRGGSLPLHTLRADIDYGHAVAYTTYGTIGIKVWLYKGEIFNRNNNKEQSTKDR